MERQGKSGGHTVALQNTIEIYGGKMYLSQLASIAFPKPFTQSVLCDITTLDEVQLCSWKDRDRPGEDATASGS